ncbi:MAG TPA: hypothetical protein VG890_11910 [Puia sp.]|nr:hypothetical protein [Puia sp.]
MDGKVPKKLLWICFAAETFFGSYGLLLGSNAGIASVLYLMAGMGFIVALLWLPEIRLNIRSVSDPFGIRVKWALALLMVLLAWVTARYWLEEIPIDTDYADMLPVIRVMNERFLSGHWKQVYDPISEIWNGTHPGYLPAMWLPYLSAVHFGFDMRWITVACLLSCFSAFLFFLRLTKRNLYGWLTIAVSALLFWWIFARNDIHGVITLSEEGPVILFHVMLCFAIASGNIYFIAVSASLCLLSRYCMIGWVLPFLLILLTRKRYKQAFLFSAIGIGCFLLFFLIPFGTIPVQQLIHLPGDYIAFASRVWHDTPEVFWLNPGLAKFFGPHRTVQLHQALVDGSFLIPLAFALLCLRKTFRFNNISLATLKLSLLVFFQFIDVPYGYLFYTASFVSLAIAGMAGTADKVSAQLR